MGFLDLFYVASLPVIKVLILTAIGLFLALENVNLLGKEARIQVNHLVHYVFNPALVGGNLADTITFENFVSLWFMPVNILITFIIGSVLGWILVKITRPPKHIEGLVIGVCSAGNLGNLPIIIIPAICRDKGSPFGDPNVCYSYGMAYASLSMAIGAVYIWSYVYNTMRVSSQYIRDGIISSHSIHSIHSTINLEASGELLGDLGPFPEQEEYSEPQTPSKEYLEDGAYTLLPPLIESEEKGSMLENLKQQFKTMIINSKIKAVFSPATIGAV